MTTRTETNTKFFAPVLHDMGNTSLFDEEDEMNMSMESGIQNRYQPESPCMRMSPNAKRIPRGLTEINEEDEARN